MRSNKTRLVVKASPTMRWHVIQDKEAQRIAAQIKAQIEALATAALMKCQDCGNSPVYVYKARILPVCASCALKRIREMLEDSDAE